MKLYNTLTRQIEPIIPLAPPKVTVYTCGPTVYDYAHIGHWFNYIRMDTLIRALQLHGLTPTWVINITDVGHLVSDGDAGEDKLEKGAIREGKTAWEVAAFFTKDFAFGMQKLHMSTVDYMPKATDHIPEQIALIQMLEIKGYTYTISDGIYYDTSKFRHYADFAQLDLDEQQAGARVTVNPEKRQATDFALWKFSPADHARDMEWDSPWGRGFPGWHIECSAMSMKYLGETLDIHTGGIDHIPVHHSNEIAQSEAATGRQFARHWMHGNHVMVDGQKISKSLHNGIRLEALDQHGIPTAALRLHTLESHYRSQSQFSWDSLEAAHVRLKRWQSIVVLRFQLSNQKDASLTDWMKNIVDDIHAPLFNDLSTPQLLANVDQRFNQVAATGIGAAAAAGFVAYITALDAALGLRLLDIKSISQAQNVLLAERQKARRAKDWPTSDRLRAELMTQHIGLSDLADGRTMWYWLTLG